MYLSRQLSRRLKLITCNLIRQHAGPVCYLSFTTMPWRPLKITWPLKQRINTANQEAQKMTLRSYYSWSHFLAQYWKPMEKIKMQVVEIVTAFLFLWYSTSGFSHSFLNWYEQEKCLLFRCQIIIKSNFRTRIYYWDGGGGGGGWDLNSTDSWRELQPHDLCTTEVPNRQIFLQPFNCNG